MAITTNLISYWKFEGNSNDAVSSNNGADTSITYGISYGKIKQGALFQKSIPSHIIVADNSNLKPSYISVAAWIRFTSLPSANTPYSGMWLINKWDGSNGYMVHTPGGVGQAFAMSVSVGGTQYNATDITTVIATNIWYYSVGTYDGSTIKIYVNGSLMASTTVSGTISNSTQPLDFGFNSTSPDRNFDGDIDEIGIWSRALTATEVQQLFLHGAGIQYPFNNGNFLPLTQ